MATPRTNATASLAIIDALDSLTSQIRKEFPDVPSNIVFALASGKSRAGAVHGHFAPEAWAGGAHEILISGESLQRGAVATLGTLIHELAHAAANAKDVKDTSNNGRYHNKRFKAIAETMGITLEQAPTIGWSITSVPEETAVKYAKGLEKLEKALTTYRLSPQLAVAPKPRNKTKMEIQCPYCEDAVTVSIQWFERNEFKLVCDDHNATFKPVEEDDGWRDENPDADDE